MLYLILALIVIIFFLGYMLWHKTRLYKMENDDLNKILLQYALDFISIWKIHDNETKYLKEQIKELEEKNKVLSGQFEI